MHSGRVDETLKHKADRTLVAYGFSQTYATFVYTIDKRGFCSLLVTNHIIENLHQNSHRTHKHRGQDEGGGDMYGGDVLVVIAPKVFCPIVKGNKRNHGQQVRLGYTQ